MLNTCFILKVFQQPNEQNPSLVGFYYKIVWQEVLKWKKLIQPTQIGEYD